MAKVLVTEQYLQDVADAIRAKYGDVEGTDEEVVLSMFAAEVEQLDDGRAVVRITDARGVTSAVICGPKGDAGERGEKGADGISPTIETSQDDDGATITLTDAEGTSEIRLSNGREGAKGDRGEKGKDGISPTFRVTETDRGVRLTVTDADGTTEAEVLNGSSGVPTATPSVAGKVKPDNDTIVVDNDGTIRTKDYDSLISSLQAAVEDLQERVKALEEGSVTPSEVVYVDGLVEFGNSATVSNDGILTADSTVGQDGVVKY